MFRIDGKDVAEDAAQAAFDAALAVVQAERNALADQVAALKDTLSSEVQALKEALADASSEAKLDAAVEARLQKIEAEKQRLARVAKVAERFPSLDLSKKSQDAIDALYEVASADPENLSLRVIARKTDEKRTLSAREQMLADLREENDRGTSK